jgi:tRNA(Ile)-lysidine synthase
MTLKVWTGPDLPDGDLFYIVETAGILTYSYALKWDLSSKVEIPTGFLDVEIVKGEGIDEIYLGQQIYVKGRLGGERCKPFGRHKSQKLKKLFQEYEIPVWQRDRLPLIYIGEKLAAVGDLWVCDEFHTKPNKQGISINWTDNLTI